MTKVKSYDKSLYPCIRDAVYEIMDRYLLVMGNTPIYAASALNDVLFFLCENDIKHEYTVIPAPYGAECDEVISLVWMEGKDCKNEVWYSRGSTPTKKHYRVSMLVETDNKDEITNWIANVNEVNVCDWSINEVSVCDWGIEEV